jgi:hypothetical protein
LFVGLSGVEATPVFSKRWKKNRGSHSGLQEWKEQRFGGGHFRTAVGGESECRALYATEISSPAAQIMHANAGRGS